MLFKHVENSTNVYSSFDGKLISLTSDHKHLGITFNEEAKWNKHVENLIKSVIMIYDIFYLIFILACIVKGSVISKQTA
jgi:hypothetical protein